MSWLGWHQRTEWVQGNRVELLENGEAYFPAVFDAIAKAERDVLIETFILFEDKVGQELQRVLIEAARRGVRIDLTLDGWGSIDLSKDYIAALAEAGVQVRMFDPKPRFSECGCTSSGACTARSWSSTAGSRSSAASTSRPTISQTSVRKPSRITPSSSKGRLCRWFAASCCIRSETGEATRGSVQCHVPAVQRQCWSHATTVTSATRSSASIARRFTPHARDVLIANAYFFPGLPVAARDAPRRGAGVRVRLVLQGQPDMKIVKHAAQLLHGQLVGAGVEIYEYCKRPMHAMVAVVDDEWATVGSSNLDPLSLSLNLEANVMIRDALVQRGSARRLERLIADDCSELEADAVAQRHVGLRLLLDTLAYHVTRRFPQWAGLLPAHAARLKPAVPAQRTPRDETAWGPR
jgi:cardiolipin synthase